MAQKFIISRTKTAAIVNCLGEHYFDSIVKEIQELLFMTMLDASNGNGFAKMYPVTVRIFNINSHSLGSLPYVIKSEIDF